MTESNEPSEYDVVVVGGGPAGQSAALYATRLGHRTAIVDVGGGRTAMIQDVHNLIGVPEDDSGMELLQTGREQLEGYGCDFYRDRVASCSREGDDIRLVGNSNEYSATAVVLATGFNDVRPEPPLPRTGRGLHYCLHCDAHMFVDEPVYVMGHGESAVHVAGIIADTARKLTRSRVGGSASAPCNNPPTMAGPTP